MALTTETSYTNTSLLTFRSDNCLRVNATFAFCSSPEELITESTRDTISRIMYATFLPVLVIIGTITNVLNCIVFYRLGLQDRVNTLLFMLSLTDLLYVLALYLRYFHFSLEWMFGRQWRILVFWFIRFHLVGIPDSVAVIANLVSILISVDRCVNIALPLKVQTLLSNRVFAVTFVFVTVVLVCSDETILFSYDTACVYYSDSDTEAVWTVVPSTFYLQNKVLLDLLDSVVTGSFVPFVSLAVMAVTTSITAAKLHASMEWRKGSYVSFKLNGKEITLTRMLIVVSGIYIACVTPRVLTSMVRLLVPDYRPWGRQCNLVVVMQTLLNGLQSVISVVNFFVYRSMGTKYKQTLRRLLCRKRCSLQAARPNTFLQVTAQRF